MAIQLDKFEPDESLAREEIVKWGREIYERGLVNGTGGNLSIRIHESVVLSTPSGWSLGHLTAEAIVKTNLEGVILSGIKPTKELPMHLAAYRARPDIAAVAHTHSAFAVAYSCVMQAGTAMNAYIPSLVAKVGTVKLVPFELPASPELGAAVAEAITESQAALMENHGVLAVGRTLEMAIGAAYEVEENARVHFVSNEKARPLPSHAMSLIKSSYK